MKPISPKITTARRGADGLHDGEEDTVLDILGVAGEQADIRGHRADGLFRVQPGRTPHLHELRSVRRVGPVEDQGDGLLDLRGTATNVGREHDLVAFGRQQRARVDLLGADHARQVRDVPLDALAVDLDLPVGAVLQHVDRPTGVLPEGRAQKVYVQRGHHLVRREGEQPHLGPGDGQTGHSRSDFGTPAHRQEGHGVRVVRDAVQDAGQLLLEQAVELLKPTELHVGLAIVTDLPQLAPPCRVTLITRTSWVEDSSSVATTFLVPLIRRTEEGHRSTVEVPPTAISTIAGLPVSVTRSGRSVALPSTSSGHAGVVQGRRST